MPIRLSTRALLLLLGGALVALACNLTTTPPTPTAPPAPTLTSPASAPTLFASITPLPGLGGGVVATQPANPTCPPPTGWIPYTVEAGDSIGALADATSTTIQDLVNGNCLSDPNTLFTGQVLYLPRSPISG